MTMRPASGKSRPAIRRRSVVLPEPEGPSRARSSPSAISRERSLTAAKASKRRETWSMTMLIRAAGLHHVLEPERRDGDEREGRGGGEGAGDVEVVVEELDVERQGVGLAADRARDHRDRAELAHGAGVGEERAVEQRPADVRQRDEAEGLPGAGAERERGLLVLGALGLHQRDELAGDEGGGDEEADEHDRRHREHHLHAPGRERRPEQALLAVEEEVDGAGDDRRDREGDLDQRDHQLAAGELVARHHPGGGDAEDHVDRHDDHRGQHGQEDRVAHVGRGDVAQVAADAVGESGDEDQRERHHERQRRDDEREGDEEAAPPVPPGAVSCGVHSGGPRPGGCW